ncbi:metal-sensing transcriptional repressor [Candidatus Soleaferrea massiliensis]|uniref:metal-sensing transcriptional repressor n=1 Tax=Candidatus Soleaferrea massiliensis TaxID=1470354 RepID=UPI00058D391B|nr:metal-sensing transcriptional repressor [Candidatus Soleaferrea massiliensis]
MRADKAQIGRLLKTARGQIDGILRMMEEDQYCIDISNQIMAAEAILNRANKEVIRAHMLGCVSDAMQSGDEDAATAKVEELIRVIDKLSR